MDTPGAYLEVNLVDSGGYQGLISYESFSYEGRGVWSGGSGVGALSAYLGVNPIGKIELRGEARGRWLLHPPPFIREGNPG